MSERLAGERRGAYFFVIDAFIGSIIIISAIVVIYSGFSQQQGASQQFYVAEDFMNVIETTQLRNYGYEAGHVKNMTLNGTITDLRSTLAQQMVLFHLTGNSNLKTYSAELASRTPERISIVVRIRDGASIAEIANKSVTPYATAVSVYSSQRVIILRQSPTETYRPVIVEVLTWQ